MEFSIRVKLLTDIISSSIAFLKGEKMNLVELSLVMQIIALLLESL